MIVSHAAVIPSSSASLTGIYIDVFMHVITYNLCIYAWWYANLDSRSSNTACTIGVGKMCFFHNVSNHE